MFFLILLMIRGLWHFYMESAKPKYKLKFENKKQNRKNHDATSGLLPLYSKGLMHHYVAIALGYR